ncbi:MAG: M48 family metallopeptidase [Sedimentisphaerales bacterium]|nr:M48 family metallopeptidase [Sedimentisphaerales bacterium]
MSGLLYNLGKKVGPKVRKARWFWQSIAGTEADALKVEYEVGLDLAHEVGKQLEIDRQPEVEKILSEISHRLTTCVANKSRKFKFEVIKNPEPNAFALPGGFIFVTSSLVELCQFNQDEIAFILAHEMGHVIKGHAMARIISNSAIATASRVAPVRGVLSGWLRKAGVQFLESAYSQDIESEADKLGVRLVAAARYETQACVRLLSRLAKLSRPVGQFDLGNYFSSHPPFDERIRKINHWIHKWKLQ